MPTPAEREEFLKRKIDLLKAGYPMEMWCVMGYPERIDLGLCQGAIPEKRARRGYPTCSVECQRDKERLERWFKAQGKCRLCGHGYPKQKQPAALRESQRPVSAEVEPANET